jgi:hypothetical protein
VLSVIPSNAGPLNGQDWTSRLSEIGCYPAIRLIQLEWPLGRPMPNKVSMADIDFTKLPAFHSTEEILAHPRFPFARVLRDA